MNYTHEIETLEKQSKLRKLKTLQPLREGRAMIDASSYLNLSSNDYLGIATDQVLKEEFHQELTKHPEWQSYSASSSRLLSGNCQLYDQLELQLEQLYGRPALFFNSGYHANMAILPALTTKDDLILSDKLVHASIIDGIKLSAATHLRFRHNDYAMLERILQNKRKDYKRVFIVTESIYSMDGDYADLNILVFLKEKYNAYLYVDEAHAVGASGETGLGVAEQFGVLDHVDLLVGTMGKALASVGAYVICNTSVRQWLINRARTFIYTTALPPINLAWSLFVLERVSLFKEKRHKLTIIRQLLEKVLINAGIEIKAESHIIPIPIGDEKTTVQLSEQLQKRGFLVLPIRPPTVPPGTSRLRLSLSADMAADELHSLATTLALELNHICVTK